MYPNTQSIFACSHARLQDVLATYLLDTMHTHTQTMQSSHTHCTHMTIDHLPPCVLYVQCEFVDMFLCMYR